MRANSHAAFALIATMAVALGTPVIAHRLDEFLQAARLSVDRDRVRLELSLTPGTSVADGVINEIDLDRNGVLSEDERHTYVNHVISALTLCVDDSSPLGLKAVASGFPDVAVLRAGDGAITIRAEGLVSRLPVGRHHLSFRNHNAPARSVYLANALVPEDDDVGVTGQERVGDQSQLTIQFVVRDRSTASRWWAWIGVIGAALLAASLLRRPRAAAVPAFSGSTNA